MKLTRICLSNSNFTNPFSSFYIRPKPQTTRKLKEQQRLNTNNQAIKDVLRENVNEETDPIAIFRYFSKVAAKGEIGEAMKVVELLASKKLIYTPKHFTKLMKHLQRWPDKNTEVINMMITHNVEPDAFTYAIVMEGYGQKADLQKMWNTFTQMKYKGIRPDVACYNTLIKWNGRKGQFDKMNETFADLLKEKLYPNHKTFQNMISAYAHAHMWDQMTSTFKQMTSYKLVPDVFIFTTMISALSGAGRFDEMEQLFNQIQHYNVYPNVELYTAMIQGYGKQGRPEVAVVKFKEMMEQGIDPDAMLVDSLCTAISYRKKTITLLTDIIAFALQKKLLSPFSVNYFVQALVTNGCHLDEKSMQALEPKLKTAAGLTLSPQDEQIITELINTSRTTFTHFQESFAPIPKFL